MLTLVVALLLASCGSESRGVPEDRQFANDPVEREEVTATPEINIGATPIDTQPAMTASPETLLTSRGTPNTLYTLTGTDLVALSVHDGEGVSTRIDLPEDQRVLDYDGSPSGDRVAVLLASQKDEGVLLAFFYSNGDLLGEVRPVLDGDESATPVTSSASSSYEIAWSPQGTGVLVVGQSMLQTIKIEGEPKSVSLVDFDGELVDAAWSPQGTRIYMQFTSDSGDQHVYVRDLDTEKTREVRVLGAKPGNGVTSIQWIPDGSGLLYVQGPLTDGVVMRGQLYVYVLGQEAPHLLSTSGQGGPSATITDALVSPDGGSVAYVISIMDGNSWAFHSMWVRAIDGSLSYQVPVESRGVVTRLSWLDRGLVWEQSPKQGVPGDIVLLRQGDEPVVVRKALTEEQSSTPSASPIVQAMATPLATPGASPVARPGATLFATPQ